jgi:hypothetical protein
VLFKIIFTVDSTPNQNFEFNKNSGKIALTAAFVPTGIKTGVVNLTQFNSISQTLAFHLVFNILNLSLFFNIVISYNQ